MFRKFHPLVLIIIGLAVFGLSHQLINRPGQLLMQLLIFGGIAGLIFFMYKRYMKAKYGPPSQSRKGKQPKRSSSNNVISHRNIQNRKRSSNRPINKRSSAPNLTVIEGKKNKKKNRALF